MHWKYTIETDDLVRFVYSHEDDPVNGPKVVVGSVIGVAWDDCITEDSVPGEDFGLTDVYVYINSGGLRVLVTAEEVTERLERAADREDRITALEEEFASISGNDRLDKVADEEAVVEYKEDQETGGLVKAQ